MTDHALNEGAIPVRGGQLRLATECGVCHKTFSNPSRAAKHALTHSKSVVLGGRTRPISAGGGTFMAAVVSDDGDRSDRLSAEKERRRLLEIKWPVTPSPRICAWCGRNVARAVASVHHLLPRGQGGTDEPRNLAIVHLMQCHDLIELWTWENDRQPSAQEWGNLDRTWGNTLVEGVGTMNQKQAPPAEAEASMGVENIGQINRYLAWFDRLNAKVASR